MIGNITLAGLLGGGAVQVNDTVTSLDQGTQPNAALVEQSAASSDSLRMQAAELMALMSAFRTERAAVPTVAPCGTDS